MSSGNTGYNWSSEVSQILSKDLVFSPCTCTPNKHITVTSFPGSWPVVFDICYHHTTLLTHFSKLFPLPFYIYSKFAVTATGHSTDWWRPNFTLMQTTEKNNVSIHLSKTTQNTTQASAPASCCSSMRRFCSSSPSLRSLPDVFQSFCTTRGTNIHLSCIQNWGNIVKNNWFWAAYLVRAQAIYLQRVTDACIHHIHTHAQMWAHAFAHTCTNVSTHGLRSHVFITYVAYRCIYLPHSCILSQTNMSTHVAYRCIYSPHSQMWARVAYRSIYSPHSQTNVWPTNACIHHLHTHMHKHACTHT